MASRYGQVLGNVLFILILTAVLVFTHLIVVRHDVSRDMSMAGSNSLDPRTAAIVRTLKSDVKILVFDSPGKNAKGREVFLRRFARESRHIVFSIVDPDARPSLARQYGITRYGQAVVLARGKTVVLGASGEEDIANALLALDRGGRRNIYVLSGHGEPDIFDVTRSGLSQFARALERSGYGVHKAILTGQEAVPWDADLLIIPGPRAELAAEELEALQGFMARGGDVMVALEPHTDGGLRSFLADMGVGLSDAMITDPSQRGMFGDESVLVVDAYGRVKGLSGFSQSTVFPTARPLGIEKALPAGTTVSLIARTSDRSVAGAGPGPDPGVSAGSDAAPTIKGPFCIALLAKKTINATTRPGIVVFGDADFLTNAYFSVSGNRELALACAGMLMHGDTHVSIDARRADERPFVLTPDQGLALFLFSVIILPAPFFLAGLLVHWTRGRA
ncbi:MAG TPA: Gldg family protein [Deltaproteobacteria bacterium]|nr:Gldg family protein [Deltaproteobacteria bacterium]HOI08129.1 Gldg family protein [Deltaproteobacteria bacterium]